MKKIFTILSLVLLLSFQAPRAHAIPVTCTNCEFTWQAVIEIAKSSWSAVSNAATSMNTSLDMINNRILIPMRDAMTVMTLMQSGTQIQNLIMGPEALLVRNPEQYIKNKGIDTINAGLGDVAKQNGVYANSVLGSVIAKGKFDSLDLTNKLATIGSSDILINEQRSRCTEASLSAQALRDVRKEDNSYNQAEYTARKTELNNALCGNLSDPKVKAAVKAVSSANPSWGTWLGTTGGDNAYTKSVQTQEAIARAAEEKKQAATKDLAAGGGIRSKSNCTKRAQADANGQTSSNAQLPCIEEEIQQASSVLSNSFKKSLGLPDELRLAGFGKGAGSLVSSAFNTISLVSGLSGALGGSQYATSRSNTSVSTPSMVKDLAKNPEAKTTLIGPPLQQLQSQKDALVSLEKTNQSFKGQIEYYQSRLDSVKKCFESVASGDGAPTIYDKFYGETSASNATLLSGIARETELIATTSKLISDTMAKMDASQSSEEILRLFTNYQNQVDRLRLPDINMAAKREGEYLSYKGDVEVALSSEGPLAYYATRCTVMQIPVSAGDFGGNGGGADGGSSGSSGGSGGSSGSSGGSGGDGGGVGGGTSI